MPGWRPTWPSIATAAFAALFDHFAPRVDGYLQRLGMERSKAEDVAQDVMAVLWHKAHLFDPAKSSLGTWLYRVARNRRIDLLRRDKSNRIDPTDPIFEPDAPEPADEAVDARVATSASSWRSVHCRWSRSN